MTVIAYARTSTAEQLAGLAAQERDLRASGAERIVSEQISSMADRPGLTDCLAALQQGDVLMVTKPDRLARSTGHLLTIVDDLNRRGVGLVVLSMGGERIDTRNATGRGNLAVIGKPVPALLRQAVSLSDRPGSMGESPADTVRG